MWKYLLLILMALNRIDPASAAYFHAQPPDGGGTNTACRGTNYYVSAAGTDLNNGTSQATPFRTIAKVNMLQINAGNCVNFRGGDNFNGCLFLIPGYNIASSAANNPIIVQSYGTGNATITGDAACDNQANNNNKPAAVSIGSTVNFPGAPTGNGPLNGLTFQNLDVRAGAGLRIPYGITVEPGSSGTSSDIIVRNNDVSGFYTVGNTNYGGGYEIMILGCCNGNVLDKVSILNNTLHGATVTSGDGGGVFVDAQGASITNYVVSGNHIYNMGNDKQSTGAGIGMVGDGSDLLNGIVSHNLIHDIGANVTSCGGVSGIETAGIGQTGGVNIFSHNEIYNVQPLSYTSGCDWDGIDMDGGARNAIVEFNYTHHNYGAGLYAWIGDNNGSWGNNIYRYNISENDSYGHVPSGGFGSAAFAGTGSNGVINFYNNTIIQNSAGGGHAALTLSNFGGIGIAPGSRIENNIFMYSNGNYPVWCYNGSGESNATWSHNDYYSSDGTAFSIPGCFGTNSSSLAQWQSHATDPGATTANPAFVGPVGGGPPGYKLGVGSPLIGAGINPGVSPATSSDYYGNALSGFNIGAYGGP